KDRQDTNKRIQAVGRECSEAVEAVTNWEVRIDWLGRKVDNTSEYVSELVLSEQECMSFIKMIIQQNQRHIPISWLLDPIMPPKPPEILERDQQTPDDSAKEKKTTIEPPAELWRDFSRLTTAFETGQARTPFSPFQRTRSRSTGQGALLSTSGLGVNSSGSGSSSNGIHGGSMFKTTMVRRPQVENLSPMPKILPPVVATNKLPVVRRRSQNLSHFPMHSWLQFQFNKTMTTPGLGQGGSKKKTNVLGFKPITIFQTTV
ncbi:hypothetical protein BGX26_011590, partial [Mortierella sp. AD094]